LVKNDLQIRASLGAQGVQSQGQVLTVENFAVVDVHDGQSLRSS
jgi:hypothetical protein